MLSLPISHFAKNESAYGVEHGDRDRNSVDQSLCFGVSLGPVVAMLLAIRKFDAPCFVDVKEVVLAKAVKLAVSQLWRQLKVKIRFFNSKLDG